MPAAASSRPGSAGMSAGEAAPNANHHHPSSGHLRRAGSTIHPPRSSSAAPQSGRHRRSSTPTNARPSLQNRTASAPLLPQDDERPSDSSRPTRAAARAHARRDGTVSIPEETSSPIEKDLDHEVSSGSGGFAAVDMELPKEESIHSEAILEINLAVVGALNVGKSTFIQRTLDLKDFPSSISARKKVSLESVIYNLRLVEISFESIEFTADQVLRWPHNIGGQIIPPIHGVFALYDITNQESISRVPQLLKSLARIAVPAILVACKCDVSSTLRGIDPSIIEQAGLSISGVESFETSSLDVQPHKRCVATMLRLLIAAKNGVDSRSAAARRRANSSAQMGRSMSPRPASRHSKHSRASSEFSGSLMKNLPQGSSTTPGSYSSNTYHKSSNLSAGYRQPPPLGGRSKTRTPPESPQISSGSLAAIADVTTRHPATPSILDRGTTFLNIDQDDDQQILDEIPLLDREVDNHGAAEDKESGTPFIELVDRLLREPVTKADQKFSFVFLCLYRKFASPRELLDAILGRFEEANTDGTPLLTRISSQMRQVGTLAQWMAEYPGDFAHPQTRQRVENFIQRLMGTRVFAIAAKEMRTSFDMVVEDDDTYWACADSTSEEKDETKAAGILSPANRLAGDSGNSLKPFTHNLGSRTPDSNSRSKEDLVSLANSSNTGNVASVSTGSIQTLLNALQNAQRHAELLTPLPRLPLAKGQWHEFMETPDEAVARELTRIDWIKFSAIRVRDFIRHVSLSPDQREKCKSLRYVNGMINQFNHVAYWVANMILLRDKPKHRAAALEKFMAIAWKLRHLNNYNSLGAVIAGINGTAVHRLSQTRELVSPAAQKNFMRLEILMGTQKSHFAYRLAWENSFGERIPFLPLHRRDLVSAEEGNPTFTDPRHDYVNWKKFEIMGEVIISIQMSQAQPYPFLAREDDVRKLVLDTKFTKDDDALYDRSVQLEPGPGGNQSVKKFAWFPR